MGTGELGFNGDGSARVARLASPTSVLTDPEGQAMVVDYSNMRVRVLTAAGTVQTVVGNGIHAYSEIGVTALETPLENPIDASYGPDGLLYVLPQHEGRVVRVEADGTIGRCVGTGEIGDSGDSGPALEAQLGYGGGLAIASDGTLFVSDNTSSRVRRAMLDGAIDTVLGTGEAGSGPVAYGPETPIRSPERLVVDEEGGRVIVADTLNHRVLAVDRDTLAVTVVAGTGEPGRSGDGGPASQARLDEPVGVAVGPSGAVLVADLENHVIRVVWPDGTIETVAGTGEAASTPHPAPALDFSLHRPAGLAITDAGDVLIAERSGHRVLRWVGGADAL